MCEVIKRNPEMVKAMVASGIQRSAVMVGSTLGVQSLRALEWKDSAAEYTALLAMWMNILAMLSSPLFGRFGDRCGRRVAAVVYGVATFLPAWALVIFGFNARGLLATSAASLLSSVACSSDAMLVLTNDVTLEEDRAMAFGLFQGFTCLIVFLLCGLPVLLATMLEAIPNPSVTAWLWYQVVLSALYFLVVMTVRLPAGSVEGAIERQAVDEESQVPEKAEEVLKVTLAGRIAQAARSSFDLAFQSNSLRMLYLSSIFIFFSGDVVFDLGSQYFRDELDLTEKGTLQQQELVSVLSSLTPLVFVVPATAFIGFLAQRIGSLRLLKVMIPFSAAMTAFGASLALMPQYWMIPVVCVAQNFAALAGNVPLKYLVAESAPEGRVGEALGTLGMVGMAVSFLANGVVAASTPVMYKFMTKPLWIFYLVAGALTLLGGLPISKLSSVESKLEPARRRAVSTKTVSICLPDSEIPCASPRGDDSNADLGDDAIDPGGEPNESVEWAATQ